MFPVGVCTDKKKIGIKYCGGCNPTFERVEMVQRAQSLMKDRFLFLRHDEQDLEAWVLINGCPRACAGRGLARSQTPRLSVIEEIEFSNLIEWLTALSSPLYQSLSPCACQ